MITSSVAVSGSSRRATGIEKVVAALVASPVAAASPMPAHCQSVVTISTGFAA
jgi:hypothetical protein